MEIPEILILAGQYILLLYDKGNVELYLSLPESVAMPIRLTPLPTNIVVYRLVHL
jgi:hypothetical protein